MKLLTLLTFRALLPLVLVFSLIPSPAAAQQVIPYKVKYESTVAAGAAIDSPVFDLERLLERQINVLVDNSAGAGARDFTFKCLAKNGTTSLYTSAAVSVSNAAPGNAVITLDPKASSVTAATRQTVLPFPICPKMSFHVNGTGAASATLAVYAR